MVKKEIKHQDLSWINLEQFDEEGAQYLRTNFKFHPLDLKDFLASAQRTKLDVYADYFFTTLLFPVFNRQTNQIEAREVDFFIGPNFLISAHADSSLSPLVELFRLCEVNDEARGRYCQSVPHLFAEIVERLLVSLFPLLDHITVDSDEIEQQIFKGQERQMVKQITLMRMKIADFRKIMLPHKNVLKKLVAASNGSKFFSLNGLTERYANLIEIAKEIWESLGGVKENIETLQQTNDSLISFKINDVIKTLTVVAVSTFPWTLLAAIFGMNVIVPLEGHRFGFEIIVAIMALGTICMYAFFKKRRWI